MAATQQDRNSTVDSGNVRNIVDYRVALERTLPPTPLRDLLAAGGATVYVLSVDQALVNAVHAAAGEQYPVWHATQWPEVEAAIQNGRCGIVLLDAALLGDRLARTLDGLEPYASRLVTIVAADRGDASNLIGYLADRKIHRLLMKPPALGITRLLLESAVSRYVQLRDVPEAVADVGERRARTPRKSARAWIIGTVLASIFVGALAVAALTRSSWRAGLAPVVATPAVGAPASSAPASAAPEPFADLLAKAELALAAGRLGEPAGDSALDHYLAILAIESTHVGARTGLATVAEALFARAESALLADLLDEAAAALAAVRRAEPSSPRLAFLEAQLERARALAAVLAAASTPPGPAEDPSASEFESLLTIASTRIERGRLLEPAGDSAREYIERAARLRPDDERVRSARADLAGHVTGAAHAALRSGDYGAAERLLAEARRLGVAARTAEALERDIVAAREASRLRQQQQLAARARAQLSGGALFEPARDSALDYFALLRSEAPEHDELPALAAELTAALATAARAALDRYDWPAAEATLAALARVDAQPSPLNELRRLQVERRQEQYLAAPAPASELRLIRYDAPAYPSDALRQGIEGWVELEYTVGRDGSPRDIVAVRAEPAGRFERASIAAIEDYRYAPFELDGQVYERRVEFRVRFTLE